MTLGNKIKEIRKRKNITQSALCQGKITRNMLSAIENDKASPSLETLRFIALALEVPLSFLVSDDDSVFFYKKAEKIKAIRDHYKEKRYKKCIDAALGLGDTDDEISYILASCHFELAKQSVLDGSLSSAKKHLELFDKHSKETVYINERANILFKLYSAVATNIKAPLLELDPEDFERSISSQFDIDFYNYIKSNTTHNYSEPIFSKHMAAKKHIKDLKYRQALTLLHEIESEKSKKNYNAYAILNLYSDIEYCYKQLADFENAYKYSTKRMTLMEQFES